MEFDTSTVSVAKNSYSLDDLCTGKSFEESAQKRIIYQWGKFFYDKSDLKNAEKLFLRSYKACSEVGDCFFVLKVLGFLVRISSEQMKREDAQHYISEAQRWIEKMPTHLGSLDAEYFYNVGFLYLYKSDFEQSIENFTLAHNKLKQGENNNIYCKTLLGLAINLFYKNKFDIAIKHLKDLEQKLADSKRSYLHGVVHYYMGKAYGELGEYKKSLESFSFASNILRKKNSWNLQGYILFARALTYKKMGKFDRALDYFRLAQEHIDEEIFVRLSGMLQTEINEISSNVDIYLDRVSRKVKERSLGTIDFKHRFILLEILFLLVENIGEVFDKERLTREIWKSEYNPLIHDKLIYTSISRLRKLIEPKEVGCKRKYLIREKGGYTFNSDVSVRLHTSEDHYEKDAIANIEISAPI